MKRMIIILALCLMTGGVFSVQAQTTFTEQDAIDLAVAFPSFHDGLAMYPGYKAAAYDTGNAYGLWRVQFWGADGTDLGWADVSPARKRVYVWESHIGATEAQKTAAEAVLRDFIVSLPDVNALMDNPAQYNMYFDYNGWVQAWGAYLDRGADSIYIRIQFDGKSPDSLDNPHVVSITFPEVLSYDEWQKSKQALAIATAFKDFAISNALNGVDGWTTSVHRQDDGTWLVSFLSGDITLAEVRVDMTTNEVVEHHIGG